MSARDEVLKLLENNGAVLVRGRKHKVYQLPAVGKIFTLPSTPSDIRAWNNTLSDLRHTLGMRSVAKTHLDFEHRKKEAFVKQVERRTEFLSGIEQRQEHTKGYSPSLEEMKGDFKEREIFSIGVVVPLQRKRGTSYRSGGRTGAAYTYSQEVMVKANTIYRTKGKDAMDGYLKDVREGRTPTVLENQNGNHRAEEPAPMESVAPNGSVSRVVGGSLEAELRNAEDQVKLQEARIREATEESARWRKVAEGIREILKVATASRLEIRRTLIDLPSNGNTEDTMKVERKPMKPRGYWKEQVTISINTTPIQHNRVRLINELVKNNPDCKDSIYQAVIKMESDGFLISDERGLLSLGGAQK